MDNCNFVHMVAIVCNAVCEMDTLEYADEIRVIRFSSKEFTLKWFEDKEYLVLQVYCDGDFVGQISNDIRFIDRVEHIYNIITDCLKS